MIPRVIDVSIIIVNYNSFALLQNCLDSIINHSQDFEYEIIVVDNNSTDGDVETITSQFNNIILIRNEKNEGFAKANNKGAAISKGKYLLFLNNDTIFVENTLQILLQYLREQNDRILIAPKLLNKDGSVQHSIYSFQTLWLSFTTYFFLYSIFPRSKYFNRYYLINRGINEITEVETVTGAFMLFNREDVLELGGFGEDYFFYGEDNDLCKRFRDSGGKIIYYPETKIIHLKGGTSKTDWFHEKYHTLAVLNLFKKHYPFSKRILARLFFFTGNILRGILLLITSLLTFKVQYFQEAMLKFKTLLLIIRLTK